MSSDAPETPNASDAPERPGSPSEAVLPPITFQVKSSTDKKYSLSLPPTTSIADLKIKLSEIAEIPADRQRLIHSGRVMKDEETLATYKIQSGHTVHMVKGAASNAARGAASGGSSSGAAATAASPSVPTNIAAGTGNNPLAGLTGARYAGHVQLPSADMFGPDGGMGPAPDPEVIAQAMGNPAFQSTMNEMLQNPQLLDYIIQSNPMLQQLGPEARQIMQSDMFRQMMTNPDVIRQMSQMGGGRGFPGGASAFPEPGRTDTTPSTQGSETTGTGVGTASPAASQNPFGAPNGAPNPFAALFPQAGTSTSGSNIPPNPFAFNPALMNMLQNAPGSPPAAGAPGAAGGQPNPFMNPAALSSLMNTLGAQAGAGGAGAGGAGGVNPLANLFGGMGMPSPGAPSADTRPPEEMYAEQLRQLNDMGFFDFDTNVAALRRSGGSVQGAINHLLGG